MNAVKEFLESNPVAERIRLESLIVLQCTQMSPRQIISLGEAGSYSVKMDCNAKIELQIGESVVAQGRIVEDSGEYFFEVSEIFQNGAEDKGDRS